MRFPLESTAPQRVLVFQQALITNNYNAGVIPLNGNGSLKFNITTAPGYALATASANSDLLNNEPASPFTFTSTLTGLPGSLVSTGGNVGPTSFITSPPVSSTAATIAWAQGGSTNEAYGSSLRLTTNPPSIDVPGPLPVLGAGAMFGFSRRLRRRVNSSTLA
jgi:hypothetical protein